MFHRESGVFKTSYAADMALYPLPIAKWAVAAIAGLFVVILSEAKDLPLAAESLAAMSGPSPSAQDDKRSAA